MAFKLADDYATVAERIDEFHATFPTGSLQSWREPYMTEAGGKAFVVYAAAAYRTPDDERPGIGWAWEPVPGTTPYTKDSELQNAETAAWGRAIVALGFDTKRGTASFEEVRNRGGFAGREANGGAAHRAEADRGPGATVAGPTPAPAANPAPAPDTDYVATPDGPVPVEHFDAKPTEADARTNWKALSDLMQSERVPKAAVEEELGGFNVAALIAYLDRHPNRTVAHVIVEAKARARSETAGRR